MASSRGRAPGRDGIRFPPGPSWPGRTRRAAGIEPEPHGVPKGYDPDQFPDNTGQASPYLGHTQKVETGAAAKNQTVPTTSETQPDVRSVQHTCNGRGSELPPGLVELARLWPGIPDAIRKSILSLAEATGITTHA